VYLNVFNHIITFLKELHEFLHMMAGLTIFEGGSFILVLWAMDLVTKSKSKS
jgi:hypothetical protein